MIRQPCLRLKLKPDTATEPGSRCKRVIALQNEKGSASLSIRESGARQFASTSTSKPFLQKPCRLPLSLIVV